MGAQDVHLVFQTASEHFALLLLINRDGSPGHPSRLYTASEHFALLLPINRDGSPGYPFRLYTASEHYALLLLVSGGQDVHLVFHTAPGYYVLLLLDGSTGCPPPLSHSLRNGTATGLQNREFLLPRSTLRFCHSLAVVKLQVDTTAAKCNHSQLIVK